MRRIENVTLVDGQRYQPGDEIWDLGSFVATSAKGRKRNYEGLSKDVDKLPHYVNTGSSAFCLDTGDFYKYLRSTDIWYKMGNIQVSCGGGGVSDYNVLNGKPQINGITLQGNITLEDLGIVKIMNESTGTPVGEIISFMGNTAPQNYLACDGTEYNIEEYPYLTQHFIDNFGSVNYFGGNGETTFAVPDLRGEFLRGTGNNSHEKQGNGAGVGEHQNATSVLNMQRWTENNLITGSVGKNLITANGDFVDDQGHNNQRAFTSATSISESTGNYHGTVTVRPTNTSVLYCIKYQPTFWITTTDIANKE